MREKVDVDVERIDEQLIEMKKLLNSTQWNIFESKSLGKTAEVFGEINNELSQLDSVFQKMVEHTIEFLENAKDGYIDADEKSESIFQGFIEGSDS